MIIVHHDKANGDVTVLQAPDDLISDLGRDWSNWPYDLGIYDLPQGLYAWDGEIPDDGDVEWEGEFRELTPEEWEQFKQGKVVE